MLLLRQSIIAQMGTLDMWMWSIQEGIFITFTIKMTLSQWKVSMLLRAIISLHWHGAAGVFLESWKTSKLS